MLGDGMIITDLLLDRVTPGNQQVRVQRWFDVDHCIMYLNPHTPPPAVIFVMHRGGMIITDLLLNGVTPRQHTGEGEMSDCWWFDDVCLVFHY